MRLLTPELEAKFRAVLDRTCRSSGLDPAGAEFIRLSANAVFRLRTAPVVVRLRQGRSDLVDRSVATARWLAEENAPTVQLFGEFDQPVEESGYTTTFWRAVGRSRQRVSGGDLALALRELHRLPPSPHLPVWEPLTEIRRGIAGAYGLDDGDRDWMSEKCTALEVAYQRLSGSLRHGPIHADATTGNLLRDRSGRLVLCDLDSVARGPLLYDLVPLTVYAIRFRKPVRRATFAYAYGVDVTRETGLACVPTYL